MYLQTINNEPRVSHRIIAENTGNEARSVYRIINENKSDFEEFGTLRFEITRIINNGKGNQPKTYYLNEAQATLLFTYLRNSEIVKQFKKALVKEFFELKKTQSPNPYQINGYKSQITQKNKIIQDLKNKLDTNEKILTKIANASDKPLKPFTHHRILDLIYQFNAHMFELNESRKAIDERIHHINSFLNGLKEDYPKSKEYIDTLKEKGRSGQLPLRLGYEC